MPDHACLFDVEPFMPDVHISIRGPKTHRTVKLWRQTQGLAAEDTESDDIGYALWERGHWVLIGAVERALAALIHTHGGNSVVVQAVEATWYNYLSGREKRADNLRNKFVPFWKWCLENDRSEREIPAEFLFEPSMLVYPFEVLPWAPTTEDWCTEVAILDSRQPWRNCWIDIPSEHPYNTTFVPCNPSVELFVPRGMTDVEVGRAVVMNPELSDADIHPGWHEMVETWSKEGESGSEDSVPVPEDPASKTSADPSLHGLVVGTVTTI
uniref:Uncharacterized protein n=1 Tax=Phytophthora ramorum TaxID=164328 RepID=H3H6W1_PHYRM